MFDLNSKGTVTVQPQFLTIKEFKDLWESGTPEEVMPLFSYIFFKHDFKSPYRRSYDEDTIEKKLKQDILQNNRWKPNKLVKEAEIKYKELQHTKTLKTLHSAEKALEQINKYFEEFDIDSLPSQGKHLAVNQMMKNLKEIDEVVSKIDQTRKKVEEELTTRVLAGKRKLRKRELPKSQR